MDPSRPNEATCLVGLWGLDPTIWRRPANALADEPELARAGLARSDGLDAGGDPDATQLPSSDMVQPLVDMTLPGACLYAAAPAELPFSMAELTRYVYPDGIRLRDDTYSQFAGCSGADMHHFYLEGSRLFGHVITRHCLVTDETKQALLRMQLGARAVLRRPASSSAGEADGLGMGAAGGDGSSGSSGGDAHLPSSNSASRNPLAAALDAHEPSSIVLLTAECWIDAMRAVMLSYDRWLWRCAGHPQNLPYEPRHVRLLLRVLVGDVAAPTQPSFRWTLPLAAAAAATGAVSSTTNAGGDESDPAAVVSLRRYYECGGNGRQQQDDDTGEGFLAPAPRPLLAWFAAGSTAAPVAAAPAAASASETPADGADAPPPSVFCGSNCKANAALIALLGLPPAHVFAAPVDSACSDLAPGVPEMASLHLSLPWVRHLRAAAAAASTNAVLAREATASAAAVAASPPASPMTPAVADAAPETPPAASATASVGMVCYTSEGGVTMCARPTSVRHASQQQQHHHHHHAPSAAAAPSPSSAEDLLAAMLTPAKHLGDLVPEVLVLPLASLPSNPVAFSWEIPQRKIEDGDADAAAAGRDAPGAAAAAAPAWHCPSCARDIPTVSRQALRAAAVNELRSLAAYAAVAVCGCSAGTGASRPAPPLPPPCPTSQALPGSLQSLLRCVETGCCFGCAAVTALGVHDSSSAREAGETGAPASALRQAFPLLTDPMWPFVAPSLGLAGQEHADVMAAVAAKLAAAAPVAEPEPAAAPPPPPLPQPFRLPSWSGLTPLDVDPRHLFARVSPANIIAVLTAMLVERKVLVVCSDRSVLADIMYTLLDLFAPLTWAGTSFTFPPDAFTFLELVRSSPQPWFGGATPTMVAAAAVEAEAEEEHAAAVMATEGFKAGGNGKWRDVHAGAPGAAPVAPAASHAAPGAAAAASTVAAAAAALAACSGSSGGGTAFPLSCTPLVCEAGTAPSSGGLPPLPPATLWWRRYSHLLGTRAVEAEEARVGEELAARAGAAKRRESVLSRLFSPGSTKRSSSEAERDKSGKEGRWAHRGGLPCLWELAKEGLSGGGGDGGDEDDAGGSATPRGHRTYSTASDGAQGSGSARGRRVSGAGGGDDDANSLDGDDTGARGGFFDEGSGPDDGRDPQSYPVVILDTDVDEVALHHLPGLYQLPLVLQARLWDAVLRWANLFTWAHPSHLFAGAGAAAAYAPPTAAANKRASVRHSVSGGASSDALLLAAAAAAAGSAGAAGSACGVAPLTRYIRCRREGVAHTKTRCETTDAALSCIQREWANRAAEKGWRARACHPPQKHPHTARRLAAPLLPTAHSQDGAASAAPPRALAVVLPVWGDSLFAPGSAAAVLDDTGAIGHPAAEAAAAAADSGRGKGGAKPKSSKRVAEAAAASPSSPQAGPASDASAASGPNMPLSVQSVLSHISSHTSGIMLPPPPAPGAEAMCSSSSGSAGEVPLTPTQRAVQLGSLFACPASEAVREEQDDDALPEGLAGGSGAPRSPCAGATARPKKSLPHDPLDCRPIVVHPPWALWRARVVAWEVAAAAVEASNDIAAGRTVPSLPHLLCLLPPVVGAAAGAGGPGAACGATPTAPQADVLSQALPAPCAAAPGGRWALYIQPPIHFTRVKLAFLKTWTRLFSGYRTHMRRDVASRVEASSVYMRDTMEETVGAAMELVNGGGGGSSLVAPVDAVTPSSHSSAVAPSSAVVGAASALQYRTPSAVSLEDPEDVAVELRHSGAATPAAVAASSRWNAAASGYATPDSSFDYDLVAPSIKPLPVEAMLSATGGGAAPLGGGGKPPRSMGSRLQRSASFMGPLSNSSLYLSLACLQSGSGASVAGASTGGNPTPSSTWSKLRQARDRGATDDDEGASVYSAGVGASSTISSVGSGSNGGSARGRGTSSSTGSGAGLLPVSRSRLRRAGAATRALETRQAVLDSVSLLMQMAPAREAMAMVGGGDDVPASAQVAPAGQQPLPPPPLALARSDAHARRRIEGAVSGTATPSSTSSLGEGRGGGSLPPFSPAPPATPAAGFGTMAFSISAPPVRDRARSVRLALAAVAAATAPDATSSGGSSGTASNNSLRQRAQAAAAAASGDAAGAFTGLSEEEVAAALGFSGDGGDDREDAAALAVAGIPEAAEEDEDEGDTDEVEAEEGEAVMTLPDDEPPPVSEAAAAAAAEAAEQAATPVPIMRSVSAGLLDTPSEWGTSGPGAPSPRDAATAGRPRAFSARYTGTDSLSLKTLLSPLMDGRPGSDAAAAGFGSPGPALFGRVRAASYSSATGGGATTEAPAAASGSGAAAVLPLLNAGSRRSMNLSMNLASVFGSVGGAAEAATPLAYGAMVSRQASWSSAEQASLTGSRGSGEETPPHALPVSNTGAMAAAFGLPPRSRTGMLPAPAAARPSCRISVVVAPSLPGAKARVMIAMEQMPHHAPTPGEGAGAATPGEGGGAAGFVPRARAASTGSVTSAGAAANEPLALEGPGTSGADSSSALDSSFGGGGDLPEDAAAASLQVITLPSSSDIFDAKTFLAEAAPLDAIPLLTWVVTSCQHWVLFVQDRYAEMSSTTAAAAAGGHQHHPDLFDLLSFRSEFLRMFRLHSLTRLPSWRLPRGVLYRGVRKAASAAAAGSGSGSSSGRVKWWAERYVELAVDASAGCGSNGPRWVLRVYTDATAVRCLDDALQAGRARLSELAASAGDTAAAREAEKLNSAVRRAEADKKAAFARRGTAFPLLPGWTKLEYSGECTLKLTNPAPGRCAPRGGLISNSGLREAAAAAASACNGRQVLTLRCPGGVTQRREWVDHLRARLVRPQDIGKLKEAYL